MQSRSLGKTGLTVSTLGFGCGNVGGLIIRGTPAERERAMIVFVQALPDTHGRGRLPFQPTRVRLLRLARATFDD